MTDRFNGNTNPSTLSRPGVLSLNIREKAALYAAYMPYLKGGGIFIPTNRQYQLGEEVFMLLSLMDDPQRIAVQGKVVWIRKESLNFQISMLIYNVIAGVLCLVLVGFIILVILHILNLVLVIVASIQASEGKFYRYPMTIRLIK